MNSRLNKKRRAFCSFSTPTDVSRAKQSVGFSVYSRARADVVFTIASHGSTEFLRIHAEWLTARKLAFLKVPLADGRLTFCLQSGAAEVHCIVAGPSPRGDFKHCVVARVTGSELTPTPIHDPHPEGGMLAGPAEWAGFFVASGAHLATV